jgi:hypothetical protein
MYMEISDITKVFDEYGWPGGTFILILFLLAMLVKSKWFGEIWSKLSDKFIERFMRNKTKDIQTNVKNITYSDISNHDIFNYIDFWAYSKVPTFQFSTEYRTVVFRKYLTTYLRSYKRNLNSFVSDAKYQQMDSAEIWKSILNLINTIVYDYEKEMSELGIPSIIIEKMKTKNNDTITLTIDLIEGICSSQFYNSDNNLLKMYSILNILLSVLENTISNSEAVCNSINGQLKGLQFIDNGKNIKEP